MSNPCIDPTQAEHRLVLTYDPQDPVVCLTVRNKLLQLSPAAAERIDRVLHQGRIILKKRADPAADQRIITLWEGTGAQCCFESISDVPQKTFDPSITVRNIDPPPPVQDQLVEMVCPRCRRSQAAASECRFCGVIVQKAKDRPAPPPPAKVLASRAEERQCLAPPKRTTFLSRSLMVFKRAVKWLENSPDKKTQMVQWYKNIANALTNLGVAGLIALALEIGLLYMLHGLWFVYTATPVGQHFLSLPDAQTAGFQYVAQLDLIMMALKSTLSVLATGLIIGTAGQLLHIVRYFHAPLNFLARWLFWCLPLAGASGWLIHREDPNISLLIAWIIAVVPAMVLLNRTLALIQTIVPEISTMINTIRRTSISLPSIAELWNNIRYQMMSYFSTREKP